MQRVLSGILFLSAAPMVQAAVAPVTLTLQASATSVVFGSALTLTATVTPANPASPQPTGTVEFSINDDFILIGSVSLAPNGQAVLSVPFRGPFAILNRAPGSSAYGDLVIPAGTHTIWAQYLGDSNYAGTVPPKSAPSSAPRVRVQVLKASTATSFTASAKGSMATYTAVVSMNPAQGTYPEGSVVVRDATGGLITGAPGGTVQFFQDSTQTGGGVALIGSASLSPVSDPGITSQATLTIPPVSGFIRAVYSGDANYSSSNSSTSFLLGFGREVNLSLKASARRAVYGAPLTIVATVTPVGPGGPMPSGNVVFRTDTGDLSRDVPVDADGQAVLKLPGNLVPYGGGMSGPTHYADLLLGAGHVKVSASYFADPNYQAVIPKYQGNPPSLDIELTKAGTTTSVVSAVKDSIGTYTAVVSMRPLQAQYAANLVIALPSKSFSYAQGTPSGTVQFFDGSTLIGSAPAFPAIDPDHYDSVTSLAILYVPVVNGSLPAVKGTVTAVYPGDSNYEPSTSAPPSIAKIVNAASLGSSPFASDEIVSVYGQSLASMTAASSAEPAFELGGASVEITDSAGVRRSASLLMASATQINLVIPAGTANGPAAATVTTVSGVKLSSPIMITSADAGIFTADGSGSGAPAAEIIRVDATGVQTVESAAVFDAVKGQWAPSPIRIGSDRVFLVLSGTGLRHATDANVMCTVGTMSVRAANVGAEASSPGIDQVKVELPAGLSGAGRVNVSVSADGRSSNVVTLILN